MKYKMIPYGEHKRKATKTWRSEPVDKRTGRKRARVCANKEIEEAGDSMTDWTTIIKESVEKAVAKFDWPDADMDKVEVICRRFVDDNFEPEEDMVSIRILNLPDETKMIRHNITVQALENSAIDLTSIEWAEGWLERARTDRM